MSMLLDALKRMERDQRRLRAPDINEFLAQDQPARAAAFNQRGLIAAALILVLLCAAVLAWVKRAPVEPGAELAALAAEERAAENVVASPGTVPATAPAPDTSAAGDAVVAATAGAMNDVSASAEVRSDSPPTALSSEFTIDGHMIVTDHPEQNRVFVAGRTVRIGEELVSGVKLLELRPGFALLDVRGELQEVPLR